VTFVSEKDGEVTTPHPLSKAAFLELGATWPRWVRVSDLLAAARGRLSTAGGRLATAADETRLLRFLLGSFGANVTHIRSVPCPFVTEISARPRASALARLQARARTPVTNLAHESVRLGDPLAITFLELLDGTRERTTIAHEMAAALRDKDPETAARASDVERLIDLNFDRVSRLALLEG